MPSLCQAPTERLDRLSSILQAVAPRVLTTTTPLQPAQTLGMYIHANSMGNPTHVGLGAWGNAPPETSAVLAIVLEGPAAPMLMHELRKSQTAALVHADIAVVQAAQLLLMELQAPRCGHQAMLASTATVLFIGVLRELVADPKRSIGLFAGLHDRRLARALVAMHDRPEKDWTLDRLAEHAGMSRTVFATQFKAAIGMPPGRYLAQLRLNIALDAVESGQGLKAAARAAGYGDTSALSRALSRLRASPPHLP